MLAIIRPSEIQGTLQAPASKSSMQRACAAALVSAGTSIIHNPGHSNDDRAALSVIHALGAITTTLPDGSLSVTSAGVHPVASEINCGESGLGIRMFAPIVALSEKRIGITGEGSLGTRPMDFFDRVMPKLGVQIHSNNGKPPLLIQGPLRPADIEIDGSLSSQFLTGLLMAYAAAGAENVCITVDNLKSRPYIDLTLKVMREFGLRVPENNQYETFRFVPATKDKRKDIVHYTVEGDWSGGAFLLVAGAIAGNIIIKGLDVQSAQADKAVLEALIAAKTKIAVHDDAINIGPGKPEAFRFDATDCPDLFPPLVALAAYCEGISVIRGTGRLAHKESNRALTLQEEFGKMGVSITLQGDEMWIDGGHPVHSAVVHSRYDHRIAMACAVAALKAQGDVTIEEAQAVGKSYPDFFEDLRLLGAVVDNGKKVSL